MVTEKTIVDSIKNFERQKTFAEFIAELLKDQLVQIYVGDSYEDVKFEQHSMQYPALFVGKVVAAFKECLIISAPLKDGSSLGNLLFISERAIRALNVIDGQTKMSDMFLTSKDALNLYNRFGK